MNNNRVLLQSGKGIGGIFRFLSNILLPVFRKAAPVIKKIAKSAPVKKGLNFFQFGLKHFSIILSSK